MAKNNPIINPSGEKQLCPTCLKMLPAFLFAGKSICMECRNLKGIHNAASNPRRDASDKVLRKYGISFSRYKKMYDAQGGACAICKEPRPMRHKNSLPFVVDHCHATNKVRGLLCEHCNSGLGFFRDSIGALENAKIYLLSQD